MHGNQIDFQITGGGVHDAKATPQIISKIKGAEHFCDPIRETCAQLRGDVLYSLFNNLDRGKQIIFEFENPNYYWLLKELKLPNFLKDQILRASSSVALTLAEGSGKRTPANQRRFYALAYGRFRQCQAILELAKINIVKLSHLQNQLGVILYKLSRKTADRTETTTAAHADAAVD